MDIENKLVFTREESTVGRGKKRTGDYEVQTTMYKIDKLTRIYCTAQGVQPIFFFLCRAPHEAYGSSQVKGSNQSYSCRPTPQPQQRRIWATSVTFTTANGNVLTEARDWTCIFMDTSQVHYGWATRGIPQYCIIT